MKKLNLFLLLFVLHISINVSAQSCDPPYSYIDLDINNVRARLLSRSNHFMSYDNITNSYEIPKGSGKHSSFYNGVWFGALDNAANLYVAGQTTFQKGNDFFTGPLNDTGGVKYEDCLSWDKLFVVYGDEIVKHKKANNSNYNIYKWPGDYAPYYDSNADGIYDPSKGDYPLLEHDQPNLIPGQMAFWIFNDVGNYKSNSNSELPLKLEVHATAYAFKSNKEAINNSTFYRYKMINKSNVTYVDFRFAYYSDFEIGNGLDDYSGCDLSTNSSGIKRNLFYKYNSDNYDEKLSGFNFQYEYSPPAIGLIYLDSKKSNSLLYNNSILSFVVFDDYCEPCLPTPNSPQLLWRYMMGVRPNFIEYTYGTPKGLGNAGAATKFLFPGDTDPQGRAPWYETGIPMKDPWQVSTIDGVFFEPGEQKEITLAIAWARDTPGTNLTSLEKLRLSSDTIHSAFKNDFFEYTTSVNYEMKSNFNIYPNPANDFITITSDTKHKTLNFKIYNLTGKVVKEFKAVDSQKIDISELPSGTYIISNNKYSSKLLKL